MPEESLETQELKEKLDEILEHEEEGRPKWLLPLSLSTAIIAVFAAISSLMAGSLANEALLEKNEAVLEQSRASDQWSFFQAKSIKEAIYTAQSEASGSGTELGARLKASADRYAAEKKKIEEDAKKLQEQSEEKNKLAFEKLEQHHKFAFAVTIFQVAIALSAIAALTGKKPLWLASLLVAAGGLWFFGMGVSQFHHG